MFGSGSSTSGLGFGGYKGPPGYAAETEDWNGTNWTEVADLNTARSGGGSGGVTNNASALAFGGDTPPHTAATEAWSSASPVTTTFSAS